MYELRNVLNMPTRAMKRPTGAMKLGSFVHRVIEDAVKSKVESREQLDAVLTFPDRLSGRALIRRGSNQCLMFLGNVTGTASRAT